MTCELHHASITGLCNVYQEKVKVTYFYKESDTAEPRKEEVNFCLPLGQYTLSELMETFNDQCSPHLHLSWTTTLAHPHHNVLQLSLKNPPSDGEIEKCILVTADLSRTLSSQLGFVKAPLFQEDFDNIDITNVGLNAEFPLFARLDSGSGRACLEEKPYILDSLSDRLPQLKYSADKAGFAVRGTYPPCLNVHLNSLTLAHVQTLAYPRPLYSPRYKPFPHYTPIAHFQVSDYEWENLNPNKTISLVPSSRLDPPTIAFGQDGVRLAIYASNGDLLPVNNEAELKLVYKLTLVDQVEDELKYGF